MTGTKHSVTQEALDGFLEPYLQQWAYYGDWRAGNHWHFLLDCCRTMNRDVARDGQREAVPFPDHAYLKFFADLWYVENKLQSDKSRQLTMTWEVCALAVHEAIFIEGTLIGYQNLGLREACDKVENYMLYMLKHIPHERMLPWVEEGEDPPKSWILDIAHEFRLSLEPPSPPKATRSPYYGSEAYWLAYTLTNKYTTSSGGEGMEELVFRPYFAPGERTIMAIPSGPNGAAKWRGYTFTRGIHDEYAFYDNLSDVINSAAKTLGTHGFQVLITTPDLGKDGDRYPEQLIEKAVGGDAYPNEKGYAVPDGVEMWRTKMRYTHVRIWYKAHPDRRTARWYEDNVLTGDIRKNQREQLLRYDVPDSDPYYSQYAHDPNAYRLKAYECASLDAHPKLELVLGQDGGRTPSTVVCEHWPDGRVVATLTVESRGSIDPHIDTLIPVLDTHYPGWEDRHVVMFDPTMENKSEASEISAATIMIQRGFRLLAGSNDVDARYQAMSSLLQGVRPVQKSDLGLFGGRARRFLVGPLAQRLDQALEGGADVDSTALKNGVNAKNKRSPYSHIMDAMEYVAQRVVGLSRAGGSGARSPNTHRRQRRVGGARHGH